MDYDECRSFAKMCDDPKTEPAETENRPICWNITGSLGLQSLRQTCSDNMGCHRNVACSCESMPQSSFGLKLKCEEMLKVRSDCSL